VERAVVVDDAAVPIAKAERLHSACELMLGREHVRRWIVAVDDLVEIHEHGAGNMLRLIFGARIPAGGG
jgi:hypothetical protein